LRVHQTLQCAVLALERQQTIAVRQDHS
jgi:hypothetical protein